MRTPRILLLTTALIALAASAGAQATFTDVGRYKDGHFTRLFGIARGGNGMAGGEAVFDGETKKHGMRWNGIALEDLGDLPGGTHDGIAQGLSWDGSVAVGASVGANGEEAFRWEAQTGMVGLGDLPGGIFRSYAMGVNADASWIVGLAYDAVGSKAVRWDAAGTIHPLGSLPGGTDQGQAFAITPDGSVIVGSADTGSDWWPFRWTEAGGVQPLDGFLPGMLAGLAQGVSDDGKVVVGFAATPTYQYAFRWVDGAGMHDLGYLPGGIYAANAMDCSGDGSVVVGGNLFPAPGGIGFETRATIWDTTHGLRKLQDVLEVDYGLDLQGFVPWVATAISSDGRVIAGYGLNFKNNYHGFVATLPDPCPDPQTFCSTTPNSAGAGALMDWNGSTSVAAADLELVATGCPPGNFGLFFYGPEEAAVPFGNGLRCVGGGSVGVFRFPVVIADPLGTVTMAVDFGTVPAGSGPGAILPGSVWKFQFWYRDPASGGAGFNLSDALSIPFCP